MLLRMLETVGFRICYHFYISVGRLKDKNDCLDHELEIQSNHGLTKWKKNNFKPFVVNFIGPVQFWSSVCCNPHRLSYRQGF
jgi:hypothetical protein